MRKICVCVFFFTFTSLRTAILPVQGAYVVNAVLLILLGSGLRLNIATGIATKKHKCTQTMQVCVLVILSQMPCYRRFSP
ncbi:hypothetical protein C7N43_17655 [Sphingobacteriales bacterium UPWRP_1]|nr:hypothetical protein BVG80_03575 [Sphingobacteriales bacterium TSM_CSM]PSJ75675.1 hypothetical protein C7N43_17655 [Sphingobacteriales bacterium UPWRP_1]